MSTAHRQANSGEAAPAPGRGTPFSCLPDDVLGIMYAQLDTEGSKRSFRHSCAATYRSRAINTQITACIIGMDGMPPEALLDFPKYATLKTLTVLSASDNEGHMELLKEAQSLQDASDRMRLSSVENFKLIGMGENETLLSFQTAQGMLDLFPRLQQPTGETTLEVYELHLLPSFFVVLAEAQGLRSLTVCDCLGVSGILKKLDRFEGLRCLDLSVNGEVPDVECLAGLHQLAELRLQHVTLGGLDVLVPQLPNLTTLQLRWVSFVAPVRLSSCSLCTLILEAALPSDLDRTSLPALQHVELRSLFLVDVAGSDASVDELVSKLTQASSMLAALPMHVHSQFWLECPAAASSSTPEVLQALIPLKQAFASITELSLRNFDCGRNDFAKLSDLFPNVKFLLLDHSELQTNESFQGLMVAVEKLERLEELSITASATPIETLAILVAAGKAGRRLTLEITPVTAECDEQLTHLCTLWAPTKHLLPSVTLRV